MSWTDSVDGRNSILITEKSIWRICIGEEISTHGERDNTKSITIQPVHYRKIEHERKSYNTSSVVMQQSSSKVLVAIAD